MKNREMPLVENANQFGGANAMQEVKIEVKEEPVDEVELTEASASFGAMVKVEVSDFAEDVPYSMDDPNQNVVKVEMELNVQRGQVKASTHRSTQHQCQLCGYNAKYKSQLEMHLRKHTGEKPFSCSHCRKAFTHKRSLQNHMKMHVEEFLFSCAVCLHGFDQMVEKLAHEKECRFRRYECHLCKQSFGSQKADLTNHIRIHSGAKPFQCKVCSKKFTEKGHLKTHMKTHAGPRSFHCSRCRLGFVHQNEVVAHEQKCNRRVYECYVCGKFIGSFKGDMVCHMRIHTGDSPFQCGICYRQFDRKQRLNGHIERIHKDEH